MGGIGAHLTGGEPVAYSAIDGWTRSRVPGHAGALLAGEVAGKPVVIFEGRVHLYEGHSPYTVAHAVREAVLAGCTTVVVTNAAGGINPAFEVGVPVLISDHLNLTGSNPLVGRWEENRSAFVDLSNLYDDGLRALARSIDPTLREGVYAGLTGPVYETPAEIRMLASMGADLVGMSTVHEAIAAHHLGAKVLGISVVTNQAAGLSGVALSHDEVRRAAHASSARVEELLRGVLAEL